MTNRNVVAVGAKVIGLYVFTQYVSYLALVGSMQAPATMLSLTMMTVVYCGMASVLTIGSRFVARLICLSDETVELAVSYSLKELQSAAIALLGIFIFVHGLSGLIERVELARHAPSGVYVSKGYFIARIVIGLLLFFGAWGLSSLWFNLRGKFSRGVPDETGEPSGCSNVDGVEATDLPIEGQILSAKGDAHSTT
ncbi:MAG: hypothetical protein QGH42_13520 [Kiritimatiellia bacterium]|nr:hypothetical protein [Kiritimatiellia bacterium]